MDESGVARCATYGADPRREAWQIFEITYEQASDAQLAPSHGEPGALREGRGREHRAGQQDGAGFAAGEATRRVIPDLRLRRVAPRMATSFPMV